MLRCGFNCLWQLDCLHVAVAQGSGEVVFGLNGQIDDAPSGPLLFEVHHPQELARYGTASHRQIVECFDRRRYALFAAPDELMALDGQTLQSLTSFSPLDQVASEILGGRFFLIARALER